VGVRECMCVSGRVRVRVNMCANIYSLTFVSGRLWQGWPAVDQEDSGHHIGQGQIIEVFPSQHRFTTRSLSTGLLEWYIHDVAPPEDVEGGVEGGAGGRERRVEMSFGDQFSRVGDFRDRLYGIGELRVGTDS